jgi:hypothetical protein
MSNKTQYKRRQTDKRKKRPTGTSKRNKTEKRNRNRNRNKLPPEQMERFVRYRIDEPMNRYYR